MRKEIELFALSLQVIPRRVPLPNRLNYGFFFILLTKLLHLTKTLHDEKLDSHICWYSLNVTHVRFKNKLTG